jgi:predicted metal-dependent phosphoesterase TrpH
MDEYNLTYEDIDKIVGVLTSNGLKGLETRHSKQTKEDSAIFSSIAKKYSLIETMGSDYHGPIVKPNVKLGVCVKE